MRGNLARTVQSGGKAGDYFKGLPIAIRTKALKVRRVSDKDIIAQIAYELADEIFITIETVGLSNVGKTAEELLNVVKLVTLELVSAAISEMDAAVLSAKKERSRIGNLTGTAVLLKAYAKLRPLDSCA